MKFVCLTCWLLCGAVFAVAQIGVEEEPDHHAGFHNDLVYILEPLFPPGHVTLEHRHSYDAVSVCIEGSMMRAKSPGQNWGEARLLCEPGGVSVNENTDRPNTHTVQNVGQKTTHLRLIENLREGSWTTFAPVSAKGLKVTRESRAFRSYDVTPGSAAHKHEVPTVVVLISGEAATVGDSMSRAGAAVYIPAGQEHIITGSGRVVEVEIR
jgi:mannose-6-phosphate isomerase-like protein (cupin superfamily)